MVGFVLGRASCCAGQDLLGFFPLLGCCLQQEIPGASQALCLSCSQAGEPASQQGLLTSAFEPRNFFLAVGDAEPELLLAALGLLPAQVPSASSHQTGKATKLNQRSKAPPEIPSTALP